MELFCTYFDKNFLPQGVSFIRSVESVYSKPYKLFVLCLDKETRHILSSLNFKNVVLLGENDLHGFLPELKAVKQSRAKTEYYYCFTPVLVNYVISLEKESTCAVYIDADFRFFQDFSTFLDSISDYDAAVFEHGRSADNTNEQTNRSGIYNVGFNYFKNSKNATDMLNWWTDRVLESTGRGEGVWGDQKYIEKFPELFENVRIVDELHLIAAPWNVNRGNVTANSEGKPMTEGEQFVMYHFARLLVINENIFLPIKRTRLPKSVFQLVYKPYLLSLRESLRMIHQIDGNYSVSYTKKNRRGLILGFLMGRCFTLVNDKMIRLGIDIPLGY